MVASVDVYLQAANPGCVLEDFVRWYSPRDYVLETTIDTDTGETVDKGEFGHTITSNESCRVSAELWMFT